MKRFLKKFFIVLALLSVALGLFYRQMLMYLLSQGKGQFNIITESISIDEALTKYQSDTLLLKKIHLLVDAKKFAAEQLHLKVENTFNTIYFPQHDTITLRVINACDALSFDEYQWKYPLIGEAPYKGFFNKERLQSEYKRLKNLGLDVDVGQVEAWSTLGIINNPMMYSVLENTEIEIAETIIHESLHATIFIKSNADFNESFAEFIGEKGAEMFLKTTSSIACKQVDLSRKKKQEKLKMILLNYAERLQQLYVSSHSTKLKLQQKKLLIHACCQEIFNSKLLSIQRAKRFSIRLMKSGNAIFSAYRTYHSNKFDFEKELQETYQGDLLQMINGYKKSYSLE